ncbi:MAG: hypothetical protein AAF202_05665, partial [Pseudomonadota bacterium]
MMPLKKTVAFALLLALVSIPFQEALALGEARGRCRQILDLEQSEDGQADWLYQQPQAFGILDMIRAPEKANQIVFKFLTKEKRLPTADELRDQLLSTLPKQFRSMFENANVLRDGENEDGETSVDEMTQEEWDALDDEESDIYTEEVFVEQYSQELYNFLMDPQPMVSTYDADGNVIEPGLFMDYNALVVSMEQADPAAYRRLEAKIANQSMLWFSQKLVPPTVRQLASVLGFDQDTGIHILFAMTASEMMWKRASRSDSFMLSMQRAEARVIQAYARAIRGTDTPHAYRTRRITPTTRRIAEVLGLTRENTWYRSRLLSGHQGRFDLADLDEREAAMVILEKQLSHMIGAYDENGEVYNIHHDPDFNNPEWIFAMPRLFGRNGVMSDADGARLSAFDVVDGEENPEAAQAAEEASEDLDAIAGGYADTRSPGIIALHEAARTMFRGTFNSYVDTNVFNQENGDVLIQKIEESKGMVISSFTPGREINWQMVEGMKA